MSNGRPRPSSSIRRLPPADPGHEPRVPRASRSAGCMRQPTGLLRAIRTLHAPDGCVKGSPFINARSSSRVRSGADRLCIGMLPGAPGANRKRLRLGCFFRDPKITSEPCGSADGRDAASSLPGRKNSRDRGAWLESPRCKFGLTRSRAVPSRFTNCRSAARTRNRLC
jgi:hypothetical protein